MKRTVGVAFALLAGVAWAQQGGREAFVQQQAYAEMQRVVGQLDVLQNNFDELRQRVNRLESGANAQALKAEIESLKLTVAELRRELGAQRGKIVEDLAGRMAKMQPAPAPQSRKPARPVYSGPCSEYEVRSGDSLFLVASAFKTSVAQLKAMNNLKGDNLRVGQKLIVPTVKE